MYWTLNLLFAFAIFFFWVRQFPRSILGQPAGVCVPDRLEPWRRAGSKPVRPPQPWAAQAPGRTQKATVTTAGHDPGHPRLAPSADGFWTVVIVKYFFFDHGKLGCCLVFGTRTEGSEGWMMLQSPTELWKKIKRFNLQAPPVYDRKVTNLFVSIIIVSIIYFCFP